MAPKPLHHLLHSQFIGTIVSESFFTALFLFKRVTGNTSSSLTGTRPKRFAFVSARGAQQVYITIFIWLEGEKRDTTLLVWMTLPLWLALTFSSIKLLYKRVNRFLLCCCTMLLCYRKTDFYGEEKPTFEWWGEAIFIFIFSTICVMFYHRLWHVCCVAKY